jgi:hypothetical protein
MAAKTEKNLKRKEAFSFKFSFARRVFICQRLFAQVQKEPKLTTMT